MFPPNDSTASIYDIVYSSFKDEKLTKAEIGLIKSLVSHDGRILEIGCGTGRHLIPLTQEGYNVIGMDLSLGMIRELSRKEKNARAFISNILTEQPAIGKFSLIMMFWNTFNEIALSEKNAIELLSRLKRILVSGGKILLNMDNPEIFDPAKMDMESEIIKDGISYKLSWKTKEYDSISNTSVASEVVRVINLNTKEESIIRDEITQRWWTKEKIQALASSLGLQVRELEFEENEEMYLEVCSM